MKLILYNRLKVSKKFRILKEVNEGIWSIYKRKHCETKLVGRKQEQVVSEDLGN